HVVLVDAGLGSYDGLRCVEQIRRSTPAARVIVMDLLPAPEEVVAYVKAGAEGFIMKDATVADFLGTVRSVAKGSDVIPPVLVGTLLSHIAEDAVVHQRPEAADAAGRAGRSSIFTFRRRGSGCGRSSSYAYAQRSGTRGRCFGSIRLSSYGRNCVSFTP